MDHVNIYTTTSFRSPNQKDGAYCYILEFVRNGEIYTREKHGILHETKINAAALQTALMALRRLKQGREIELTMYADNHYLDQLERAAGWQAAGWKNRKGEQVANAAEWEELLRLLPKGAELRIGEQHEYHQWMMATCRREEKEEKQKAACLLNRNGVDKNKKQGKT